MAEIETEWFTCDACGKTYRWRAELSGKKVKCVCGHVMVAPDAVAALVEEEPLYDLAPDAKAKPAHKQTLPEGVGTCPACAAHLVEGAMLCVQCGHNLLGDKHPTAPPAPAVPMTPPLAKPLAYAHGAAVGQSPVAQYFPDRIKDLHIPLALIVLGTAIEVGLALFHRSADIPHVLAGVGIYMLVNTALMLLAVFAVAKMRDIAFGPLPTAILKLCGISIGPGAIGSAIGFGMQWLLFGGLIGWAAGFVLYFASIGALFDLDESDTWSLVITVFLIKLLVVFVIIGMVLRGMV